MKIGLISVQNPANGLVVKLLNPQPGQTIFDGCSAPGGKSTYISELTNGKSEIYSYDNDEKRIKIMKNNLKRLNINNIKCKQQQSSFFSSPIRKLS